ncbi:carboxypeptidase-like regulatory domain-containing protein [Myxococcota bacterium]
MSWWTKPAGIVSFLALAACGEDINLARVPRAPDRPVLHPTNDDRFSPDWTPNVPAPTGLEAPESCQTGALMGRLCLPGSDDALVGAHVYLYAADCSGLTELFGTVSLSNGQFSLAGIPQGEHTVHVEHDNYYGQFDGRVVGGEITIMDTFDSSQPLCLNAAPPRMAVFTGEYDAVEAILGGLDLSYDLYSSDRWGDPEVSNEHSEAYDLLADFEKLTEYDVLLFNCGGMERDFIGLSGDYWDNPDEATIDYGNQIYDNLRRFVMHGGKLYASDWAWPVVEGLNPTVLDFLGDDTNIASPLVGESGSMQAELEDQALQLYLATSSIPVDYDLSGWAVIDEVSPQAQVFVRGDARVSTDRYGGGTASLEDKPLFVGFRPFVGGGLVIYTTFHYHSQPSTQMIEVLRFMIFQL